MKFFSLQIIVTFIFLFYTATSYAPIIPRQVSTFCYSVWSGVLDAQFHIRRRWLGIRENIYNSRGNIWNRVSETRDRGVSNGIFYQSRLVSDVANPETGRLNLLLNYLPRLLDRMGIRFNSEQNILTHPNVESLNARLANPQSNELPVEVRFWRDTSVDGASPLIYLQHFASGEVPLSSQGQLHNYHSLYFHDLLVHGPGFLLIPNRILNLARRQASIILELRERFGYDRAFVRAIDGEIEHWVEMLDNFSVIMHEVAWQPVIPSSWGTTLYNFQSQESLIAFFTNNIVTSQYPRHGFRRFIERGIFDDRNIIAISSRLALEHRREIQSLTISREEWEAAFEDHLNHYRQPR